MALAIFTGAALNYMAGVIAVPVGTAITEIFGSVIKYTYIDPDNGYFRDHPEDDNRENTPENLIKRVKAWRLKNISEYEASKDNSKNLAE